MQVQEIQLPFFPDQLMMWLVIFVFIALFLAAILHWKLSRHWSLLVLAIALLCFLFSNLFHILVLLGVDWIIDAAIGYRLPQYAQWVSWAGVVLAGIGAIGAICRAVKLGRIKGEK